ncbi:hypothetical protein BDV97DRAFT_367539 [Delphinella strobiligena]|nr:hypothetical protein BDV97DRAFT_367539 [Delphinella strobiligena]
MLVDAGGWLSSVSQPSQASPTFPHQLLLIDISQSTPTHQHDRVHRDKSADIKSRMIKKRTFNHEIAAIQQEVVGTAACRPEADTELVPDKRWASTATPPPKDPYDAAQLARMIEITLPSGINVPGMLPAKNMETIREDMTNVELFETFRAAPSNALVGHVNRVAQTFLDGFVRQNIMQHDHMPYDDFIVPINLNLDHALVYNEQSQRLNSQDMRLKMQSKNPRLPLSGPLGGPCSHWRS